MKAYKIDLSGFTGKVREVVSEAVQKKAFELGWAWKIETTPISIHHSNCPVLYLEGSGILLKDDGISNWHHDPNTAIAADAFLALTTAKDEPRFKPFDKVLVRDSIDDEWMPDFYAHSLSVGHYVITGGEWSQCIPYEGNEALLGTTDSPV
jgi:hypothetical protein